MTMTTDQRTSALFKKMFGKGSSAVIREFYEEPVSGRPIIYPTQIWTQAILIPSTAPTLNDGEISGVVQKHVDKVLTRIDLTNAYYHEDLKDAIPFNTGDGSYNYTVKDSTDTQIPFGQYDWVVDPDTGILTFYNGAPTNIPPKITFYKYVGSKGFSSGVVPYMATHNNTSDWSGPASGYYYVSITGATHGQGNSPLVLCYELSGSLYNQVTPDTLSINPSNGNILVKVPDDPDIRYTGKIVVQKVL